MTTEIKQIASTCGSIILEYGFKNSFHFFKPQKFWHVLNKIRIESFNRLQMATEGPEIDLVCLKISLIIIFIYLSD